MTEQRTSNDHVDRTVLPRAVVQSKEDVRKPCNTELVDALFSALGWEAALVDTVEAEDQGPYDMNGPWVLSIDDDSELSFSLKVRLARKGIDVLRASEGMQGFRYAFAKPPKAIVLDYEMPDVNGDYVLRRLKENHVTRSIPVLVLTGHRDGKLKHKMFSLGASSFLTKPVRWEVLWSEIQKHVLPPKTAATCPL
ncbi:MAG: response regulator [Pirellulaceae bacterium]|nr:response regulator [Planctomycetales bacterium]